MVSERIPNILLWGKIEMKYKFIFMALWFLSAAVSAEIYKCQNSDEKLKRVSIMAGEMIFTPPMEDHACVFTEDTLLVVASRNPRDQQTYESDVVRIELINPDDISA